VLGDEFIDDFYGFFQELKQKKMKLQSDVYVQLHYFRFSLFHLLNAHN